MDRRTTRTLILVILAAGIGLLPATTLAEGNDAAGWIPFDGSSGQIVLQGAVDGEPARIILDSGASVGAVSAAFAERAGIESNHRREYKISGVFDNRRVPASQRFELELNESVIPLIDLPIVPRGGFDLLLGRPVFDNAVVQIDYPNERIRFLDPEAIEFEGNVAVRRDFQGDLMLEVELQGEQAWLVLDTGNAGVTLLKRRFVQRHGFESRSTASIRLSGEGVLGTGDSRLLHFDHARLGPYRFESFLASYIDEANRGLDHRFRVPGSRIRRQRSRHDGLLGHEILGSFLLTIDHGNARVHLHLPQD